MYWHELNEKRIAQLKSSIAGKKVIIVGNSIKLLEHQYGKFIDSYDIVVRIGKGIPQPDNYKIVGRKTDVWFSGMFRASLYKQVSCKWKILTPSCSSLFELHTPFIPINKALFNSDFQPYRDYFWSDSIEQTNTYWRAYGFDKDSRPSQGVICCDFFSRRLLHNHVDVIGFDFFTNIKQVDGIDYSSWHFPKKITDEVPHKSDLEKNAIYTIAENYNLSLIPYND